MAEPNPALTAQDTETLDMLRESAADFCARSLDVARLRALRGASPAFDRDAWRAMCELGWSAVNVPEAAGGLGLGLSAVGAVCRQLGRVAAPEPMIETVAAASILGTRAGEAARSALDALVAGESLVGVALAETSEFPVHPKGLALGATGNGQVTLTGDALDVPHAADMTAFIVPAEVDTEAALVLVRTDADGLSLTSRPLADGTSAATLTLDGVRLDEAQIIARGTAATDALAWARETARLATSAYLLGSAEALLETTLDYLRDRKQFGRAIGSFQALQHRAVDLYLQQRLAQAVVRESLAAFDAATDDTARAVAASRAKYRAGEAALAIAKQAVQLHGGMGFTDECDVGLYLNRVLVLAARYGNGTWHARRLFTLLRAEEDEDNQQTLTAVSAAPKDGDWNSLPDETFRMAVRHFFLTQYPNELRFPASRPRWAEIKDWYLKLSAKGWVAPAWPREHGGMGLSPTKMLIYIEEQERCGVARAPDMGIQMVGPLLMKHGTAAQRERYLPKIIAGEEIWCQGYSEPNAGSDLASLQTSAVADGDEFVINGQKTWTTLAQDATHMFCLARTSREGKPQEGISFFLIDLDQPGVTIRPIRNIAGHEEFCEVFLDDVRVAADCLVGEINQGWTIAKALLSFERIFLGSPKQCQYALQRLEELADACGLYEDAGFADRLVRLKLDVRDLESVYTEFADIVRRGETLGADVSLLKLWATETFARLSELMLEAGGALGATAGKIDFGGAEVDTLSQFYNARPATIYAGTNEIQRNILSKNVLKLPG